MTKHRLDHRQAPTTARLLHYLRIARAARATWHRREETAGAARVVQFCRIARGRLA